MITKIDAAELQRRLREAQPLTLIDVLPEEVFKAQHLPGARNACVYEVTFLDQVKRIGVNPSDPLVVYGAGSGSLDSTVAAKKLDRAGFSQVFDFSGGRFAWAAAGGKFEGTGELPPDPPSPEDRTYSVDTGKSMVEWIGRNLNSTHRGTMRVANGQLRVRSGGLKSGDITVDVRSLENTDIPDPAMRRVLEAHLKSDDFFDVEMFPVAKLVIRSSSPLPDATPGSPNQQVRADLTIKDVTHPIEFPAIISGSADRSLIGVAELEIDRTRWNVRYGSGRFFKMLGKHLVNDPILLLMKVVAR